MIQMKPKKATSFRARQIAAALILTLIATIALTPVTALAHGSGKTLRVGWYESSFNTTDESGRRSGYAY